MSRLSPQNKGHKSNSKSPGSVKWQANAGSSLKLPLLVGNKKEIIQTHNSKEARTARVNTIDGKKIFQQLNQSPPNFSKVNSKSPK